MSLDSIAFPTLLPPGACGATDEQQHDLKMPPEDARLSLLSEAVAASKKQSRRPLLRRRVSDLPDLSPLLAGDDLTRREKYLAWRGRRSRWKAGDSTPLSPGSELKPVNDVDFEYWYPTVKSFTFRRTYSYWVAVFFCEGCLLFLWAPFFQMYGNASDTPRLLYALTKVPSLCGGTQFLLGCYMGYFGLINMDTDVDEGRLNLFWCDWEALVTKLDLEIASIVGWIVYLVGALFYQIALTADLFELSDVLLLNLVEWPFVCGGFLFFIGGACEVWHNRCFVRPPVTAVWWVSVLNALGGLGFWLSACPSVMHGRTATIVGAVATFAYYIASVLSLFMWRGEQFGLALLSELNNVQRDSGAQIEVRRNAITGIAHVAAKTPRCSTPKSPGSPSMATVVNLTEVIEPKLSGRQLIFVNIFIAFGALQILTCCASLSRIDTTLAHKATFTHRLNVFVQGFGNVSIVHMVLILFSACIRMPKEEPYRTLAKLMRLMILVGLFNSAVEVQLLFENRVP